MMRNRAVEMLALRGLVTELRLLADGQPPPEQALIRHYLRPARQAAADNAQARLHPSDLLNLLGRSDLRLIRNSSDLVGALLDHFDELQHEISRNNGFRDPWSPNGNDLGSEDDITDWVRRRLTEWLGPDRVILTPVLRDVRLRHTTLTWVERHFGYGIARAYAGHTDSTGPATTTYIKADLQAVATALSAMTGQPHPLAT
jgi:hypothetical protein